MPTLPQALPTPSLSRVIRPSFTSVRNVRSGSFLPLQLLLLLLLLPWFRSRLGTLIDSRLASLWRPSRSPVAVLSVCDNIYTVSAYTFPSHDHDRPPHADHILLLYHLPRWVQGADGMAKQRKGRERERERERKKKQT